jgi:nucleoside-diphosphate-sugar epimerase
MSAPLRVLVTGGAGFLGRRVLEETRDLAKERGRDVWLRVLDLDHCDLADESLRGDVTDEALVRDACEGIDVVVHSAALIDWGSASPTRIHDVNVGGTHNVLAAARAAGARGVLYTSTMDCVMDGRPLIDIDEGQPYPERFMDAYAESKAIAERVALAADGEGLRTAALRPCGMYGEADPYHMDNVLRAAREGKLTFRMGAPETVFTHVYVGNVAHAHSLALFELAEPQPSIAGRPYFVTDQPAHNFFEFMKPFVERKGYAMPDRSVPAGVAKVAGAVVERACKWAAPIVAIRPFLTRSSVSVLVNSISIRSQALERDLGYLPRYGVEESARRVMEYYDERDP